MTRNREDAWLEDMLHEARDAEAPHDDLVARVLADADRVQGVRAAPPAPAPAAPRAFGWRRRLVGPLGGWSAVSGVTLAGLTGLIVGFTAPDLVDSWSGGQLWILSGGGGTMPEVGALWDGTWEEMGDV